MTEHWPAVHYDRWGATCDTLHAHTQVLGKLAVELAPPEPELLHAALRLTTRGWETGLLPAPDGSGSLVVALDLHAHQAVVEHSRGSVQRVPLVPDRPVAEVTGMCWRRWPGRAAWCVSTRRRRRCRGACRWTRTTSTPATTLARLRNT